MIYFASQRFAIPVYPQMAAVAVLPIGWAIRRAGARPRPFAVSLVVLAVWCAGTGFGRFPTRMHLEAEELDGFQARTVADPLAVNHRARFAPADAGVREAVRLSGEFVPRGAYGVHVRARTQSCDLPDRVAMTVVVRNADRAALSAKAFRAGDLCGGDGYATVTATGAFDRDQLVYVAVETADVDLWIDRIDLLLAYADARGVMAATGDQRRLP